MLWGYFTASGTGNLVQVLVIMKKKGFVDILKDNFKKSAACLDLGHCWVKHTFKLVQNL